MMCSMPCPLTFSPCPLRRLALLETAILIISGTAINITRSKADTQAIIIANWASSESYDNFCSGFLVVVALAMSLAGVVVAALLLVNRASVESSGEVASCVVYSRTAVVIGGSFGIRAFSVADTVLETALTLSVLLWTTFRAKNRLTLSNPAGK